MLAGPVTASSQKKQRSVIPEGKAGFGFVHIAPVDRWRVLQGQHIGAVLVQLEKITAVLVQKRKVGGDDDVLRLNRAMVGHGPARHQLQNPGVLVDLQPGRQGSSQLQGMKLGLI